MIDTGVRLSEIVGLEVQDVDLQERSVTIKPNNIRGLKTKGSHRTLPLSQEQQRHCRSTGKAKKMGRLYSPNTLALVAMMLPLLCS